MNSLRDWSRKDILLPLAQKMRRWNYSDLFSLAIAEDLGLPDGMIFFAATPDGQIAMHSDPDFLQADESEAGVIPEETATIVSTLFGWTFGVGPSE